VTDLAAQVAAALERGILPSVIARGGAVRVAAARDGVVTLEVTGSPGAVYPLAARIEAVIRAAVPGVTAVRLAAPGTRPAGPAHAGGEGLAEPPYAGGGDLAEAAHEGGGDLAEAARRIIDAEVNPAIAAHHGRVTVTGASHGWIRIRLDGGCQGCSLAEVTIRQGIEPLLRARLPAITGLIDVTDHEAGTDPFFSPEKR
jgi:Fe-S cluster biogenesis protein NfuA